MAAKKPARKTAKKTQKRHTTTAKVGSSAKAAKKFGGRNDFGAAESNRRTRQYVSKNTKESDRGASQRRSGSDEGRVSGVGGRASGRGSSSGGDLDTDLVGVGTGGSGISESGPDDRQDGADMVEETRPPKRQSARNADQPRTVRGSTVDRSGGDASTTGSGRGAAAVTNPARNDDSFAGEISNGEAGGDDN